MLRNDHVVWKFPLTGGGSIQEIILRGADEASYDDAIVVEDGFVLMADVGSGAVRLEFYDLQGMPVNVAGATTGNDIFISDRTGVDLLIDNGDTQPVKIKNPQTKGISHASFPALPGTVTPVGARIFQFDLLLEGDGDGLFDDRMIACRGQFNPQITQRQNGSTTTHPETKALTDRLLLLGNMNRPLDPIYSNDWAQIGSGNFATYHIVFQEEVDRGQQITLVRPGSRTVVHFSGQRALLGSQRLTEVPTGESISYVDGDLVNIAAEGETANNQTRMLAVVRATGPIDVTRPTRKGGDFYYYGGDSIPIGPHEVTIAIEGEPAAGDVNRDGAVTVADLILVAVLFGQQVPPNTAEDINGDGTVDMGDLLAVAQSISPAAPSAEANIDAATIEGWIAQARLEDDGSVAFRQGIENLQAMLRSLIP